jgi:hypothetical protein
MPKGKDKKLSPVPLIATKRYQSLVGQLYEQHGKQKRVAELLYIKQPHVSRLIDGTREAGVDAIELAIRKFGVSPAFFFRPMPIELAIRKFGVSPAFFFRPMPTEPHYAEWKGPHKLPPEMGYPALHTFLKMADETGMKVTAAERQALAEQEWAGYPTVQSYLLLLQALRALDFPEVTEVKARPQATEEAPAQAGRRPRRP